jgi:hypothetical protein
MWLDTMLTPVILGSRTITKKFMTSTRVMGSVLSFGIIFAGNDQSLGATEIWQ